MLVVNTETIPGYKIISVLGMVRGSSIRAKNLGYDIGSFFKSLVGGELKAYGELLDESREDAINKMQEEADRLGGNAVLNVRFASAQIMSGAAEILAYGTAVIIEKNHN